MHFWELVALVSFDKGRAGSAVPKKSGLNCRVSHAKRRVKANVQYRGYQLGGTGIVRIKKRVGVVIAFVSGRSHGRHHILDTELLPSHRRTLVLTSIQAYRKDVCPTSRSGYHAALLQSSLLSTSDAVDAVDT